jgi:AcrR family transcriptional regulator
VALNKGDAMPKVVDHELRRAIVIEATCRVIATEGLEAATIRRIAKAAGCTTGLVTHYFSSKDDIVLASMSHVFAIAEKRVVIDQKRPPLEALEALMLIELPLTNTRLLEWRVWLVFWGSALTSERLIKEQSVRYEVRSGVIEQLLHEARKRKELAVDVDPQLATSQILGFVDGLGMQGVFSPSAATRKMMRLAVSDYVDRLRPPKHRRELDG